MTRGRGGAKVAGFGLDTRRTVVFSHGHVNKTGLIEGHDAGAGEKADGAEGHRGD